MAANKRLERGIGLPMKVPAAVKSGAPLVFGTVYGRSGLSENFLLVGVANEDATDAFGNVKPLIGVDREGAFAFNVEGEAGCPLVQHQINPGDPVYADINGPGSVYDATTNCWTGFALNGNEDGVLFGYALDKVTANSCPAITTNVRVLLK